MNVFELFGSIGLDTTSFDQGMSKVQSGATSAMGVIGKVIDVVKKADNVITTISDTVAKTTAEVVIQTAQFAKSFDENVMGVVSRANEVIAGALGEMTDAAVGFFKSAFEEGLSFESAMGQVSATMLRSRDDFDETKVSIEGFTGSLRDLAKYMGSNTIFTATQAGQALNYMALAGYDEQTSAEMLGNVLDLAAAGMMDLGYASDIVTDAQTALGIKMEDMTLFVDELAKTASSSNTSVSQLGEALLSIGATGRQVKGGFTELNTVLGVLANNGIKASEGGNMLRRVLTRLTTADGEAGEVLKNLGVSVFDTEGNMRDLPQIFQDLGSAMDGLTEKDKVNAINTIFGQYALAGANALLNTTAEQWETLGEKIADAEGAAAEMAKIQRSTLTGQITILRSALSGIKIGIFDKIAPITKDFVVLLSDGLSNMADEIENGSIATALSDFGGVIAEMIKKGVDFFLQNTQNVKKAANGIRRFIEKVGHALLYAAVVLVPTVTKLASDIATNFIKSLSNFLSNSKNITAIQLTIQGVFNTLREFFSNNRDSLYNILSALFDLAIQFVDDLFLLKRETVYSILSEKLLEIVKELPAKIKEWLSSDGLNDTVDNVLTFIGDLASALIDSSAEILPDLLDFVLNIGDKVITGIAEYLSDSENVDKIRGTINLLLLKIENFLTEHEDDLYNIFSTIWDVGIGFIQKIFELRRKTTAKTLGRKIKEIWDESWGGADGIKTHLLSLGSMMIGGIWSGLWYAVQSSFDITKIGGAIIGAFKDFFEIHSPSTLFATEIGENLIKGLWNGINSPKDWLIEKIGGFTDGVVETFKNFFGIESPSTVFRDEVGAYLAQGIGVGFEEEMDKVSKDMEDVLPTSFDVSPKITNLDKRGRTDNYIFEFHIGNMSGISERDGIAFAETVSNLIYNQTYRQKEAFA